jgi:(p)ppGpp synthase/HD superfamily hydrolase
MSNGRTIPGYTERFTDALSYASRVHRNQPRKETDIPYVGHLLGVASICIDNGATEDEAISALLHDAPEDQGGRPCLEDIRDHFGSRVAEIVEMCSDSLTENPDAKEPWNDRKAAYHEHLRGTDDKSVYLVSAADKLHNARSMLVDLKRYGDGVWNRFKGKRDGTLWNFDTLISVYRHGPEDARRDPIVDDLCEVVAQLKFVPYPE